MQFYSMYYYRVSFAYKKATDVFLFACLFAQMALLTLTPTSWLHWFPWKRRPRTARPRRLSVGVAMCFHSSLASALRKGVSH